MSLILLKRLFFALFDLFHQLWSLGSVNLHFTDGTLGPLPPETTLERPVVFFMITKKFSEMPTYARGGV